MSEDEMKEGTIVIEWQENDEGGMDIDMDAGNVGEMTASYILSVTNTKLISKNVNALRDAMAKTAEEIEDGE